MHHAQLTESVTISNLASQRYFQMLQNGGLSYPQAAAAINHSIDVQSHLLAANDVFLISAILFAALIAIVWLASRPRAAAPADAGAAAH
jgi:DHA2 family multidrug resistance protein